MNSPRVHVGYDADRPGMYLAIEGQDVVDFMRSTTWRAWLYYPASAVEDVEDGRILLDGKMGLRECQEMRDAIAEVTGRGFDVVVDPSFASFVNEGETYIRERSEIGLAVKSLSPAELADDPRLGDKFQEFREVVDSSMVRPLRDRQAYDAFFMAVVGRSADFSVPGAGKTATVLGTFAYLRHLGLVRRVVVVCPKNAFESWEREWGASFGGKLPLSLFSLGDPAVSAMSPERRRRTLALDSGSRNLLLFNYESLRGYVDELRRIVPDQTLLVFDEVHRVKAIGGRRAEAALEVAKGARHVIALTGTPIPNTYQDVYNLLHVLYQEDYDTFFGFDPLELKSPDAKMVDEVNRSLAPFFCRTSKDELGVPSPEPDSVIEVEATPEENELLRILYGVCPNPLALVVRTLQLESDPEMLCSAVDPGDLEHVLDQVGDDYADIDFVDFSKTFYQAVERSRPSSKLVACERLVADIVSEGRPVIVWCVFVRSIANMCKGLNAMGIAAEAVFGGTPQEDRTKTLDRFRAGKFRVLVTNPQTLAESVSLHTVCHDAVYFEYGYNLVHLLQSKDRIHRLGLPEGQKTRYHFLRQTFMREGRPFSLDEAIYERLAEKERTMLEAIDSGRLEGGYVDEDDLEIIFARLLVNTALRPGH